MTEEATPTQTKKPRGPAKTAAQKMAELVETKRRQVEKLDEKHTAAWNAEQAAKAAHKVAADELKKLEEALEALS